MGGKESKPVAPPPSPLLSEPWRALPENNRDHLRFAKSYQPRRRNVSHLRILLHGPVGAGKSSFINSVDSVLRGQISARALTDAISGTSFTKEYKTYKIHKDAENFYSVIFNDIMGLEQSTNSGVNVEDIKLAMKGHVKEGYKFIPGKCLTKKDKGYNPSPTAKDKVHVLVCVLPVDSVSLMSDEVVEKMRDVRLAASEMGIPQLAILTKVDEACPEVQRDINNVYKSKHLKEQYTTYKICKDQGSFYSFIFNDIMGSEQDVNNGVHVKDIKLALRGHVVEGYQFIPGHHLTESDQHYNKSPTLDDKVHVQCCSCQLRIFVK